MEDGFGVFDVVVAEVCDNRAVGRLGDGHRDRERHSEQTVDEALAEVGVGGELGVEMERLLVHREVAETLVVRLADRTPSVVFYRFADLELAVVLSCHAPNVGLDRIISYRTRRTATMNARRSVLFTPGDEPEMMRKALEGDADVVVFDLEDAVAPDEKEAAREAVKEVLDDVPEDAPEVWVRLNPFGGDIDGRDDIDALNSEPSCFVVPKAGSAEDVEAIAEALDESGTDAGVVPIVESAAGVVNASGIASASRVSAVVFGAEDLAADLGATRTDEGNEVVYARQRVVAAATAADVDAVDTLWTDFRDDEGLRADTERGIGLGYDGKLAIHPAQVGIINDAFTPEPDRVDWARHVLEAKEEADEAGKGVFEVDGEMVDAPLVEQARTVKERARAAGVWSSG